MRIFKIMVLLLFFISNLYSNQQKKLAYIVSDINIPFWQIISKGIKDKSNELGYEIHIYSSNNLKKNELENLASAISLKIDGLIISPINSSTASTLLEIAKMNKIPTIVADIGSDSQDYLSFISSDNKKGAYELGKILSKYMKSLSWNKEGTVGIIAIPQKRLNGKDRTIGFIQALEEDNIKVSGMYQQVDFSYEETYNYSKKLIDENKNLRAIWLQGSDKYKGALDAIKKANKQNEIALICFDAEPEFLEMIQNGDLVASAMQQPYIIGQEAVVTLNNYFNNKEVKKEQKMEILSISKENIDDKLKIIKLNVLGIKSDEK
ncbi:substrate-binding domain-containing protein [Aliarcobacter cryaerophilus]|uniref:Substrate-binding domain-containing protein n=2 Tax=unclassified Arcobacter TaxID=2593671 RepID=A0AA96CRU2_9BACT|nr:substrate-binding domain-containing protein [Aliarcobacter cryaerophilus]WNL13397.1 substrate-binding domain-containing protein [Arcobacter sp. AZ-2023]WPD09882.1 substrate-binding domain-containing protein [Arcobacter sp. DSM 115954]MCT7463377.1 substrate-binding domain-containing protein [Aliarcobacter cryaerophilus]MCT7472014.1 substrate-binding domain-containing protein [Aliarcobacter cryaerophilus]WNL14713.1 substrate-binding domain-containing protein [Arcobacter sp. AZ-2023]